MLYIWWSFEILVERYMKLLRRLVLAEVLQEVSSIL
jgi:hypothetical protein